MVAALTLLVASCGDGDPAQPSYAEAPCPNPVYPGIVLGPDFTCGYLTVPENRNRSDSRNIRLAVATRKATALNPKPDPILFLTGGPGGSGLGEGPGIAKAWHPDRDVIFLDQRGALKSDPFLSCPEIDTFMESTVGLSWLAPETIQQDAAVTRKCRDRLAADEVHDGPRAGQDWQRQQKHHADLQRRLDLLDEAKLAVVGQQHDSEHEARSGDGRDGELVNGRRRAAARRQPSPAAAPER